MDITKMLVAIATQNVLILGWESFSHLQSHY